MYPEINPIFLLLITISIGIVLFVILREFTCWYFKMNETVKLLTEIRDSLIKRKVQDGKA